MRIEDKEIDVRNSEVSENRTLEEMAQSIPCFPNILID